METIDNIAKLQVGIIVTGLFEKAVTNANNGKLDAAVAIMERIIPFIDHSDIDSKRIYILGFYCQICLDMSLNSRAIWLYNLAISYLNERKKSNTIDYEDDMDMFHKLESRINRLSERIIN